MSVYTKQQDDDGVPTIQNAEPTVYPKKKVRDPKQFRIARKLTEIAEIEKIVDDILEKKMDFNNKTFILKDTTNSMNIYADNSKVYLNTPS